MKKKPIKIITVILCTIVVLWSAMFVTDYIRCQDLKEPIFVIGKDLTEDGTSGVYQGVGYTVEVRLHKNLEGEISPEYVEMKMFGMVVSAAIV